MKLPPFDLERYFAQHEFTARHLLCASDCESMSLGELLALDARGPDAARAELEKLWLGYTESPGGHGVRSAIAALYRTVKPENVLVHAGAEEAIYSFAQTVLGPGDHAIVHWPCYQSLYAVAESVGCQISRWEGDPQNNWELDVDWLARHLTPKTKVVVVNSPHNPTGYALPRAKFDEVVRLCDERGIILFLDEVYKGLEYDAADALPSACDVSPNAVSLGVMSKTFGLAGLRIGWVATKNRAVFEKMAAFKDYTTICNAAPSEFLTALALQNRAPIVARNRALIAENLLRVDEFFSRHADKLAWARPKAGCLGFAEIRTGEDSETFCGRVLRGAGVLLAPSTRFHYGGRHFRIGFGRASCPAGLAALDAFLA